MTRDPLYWLVVMCLMLGYIGWCGVRGEHERAFGVMLGFFGTTAVVLALIALVA